MLRDEMTAAERTETPGPLLKVLRDKLAKMSQPASVSENGAPALVKPKGAAGTEKSAYDGRFIREGNAPKMKAYAIMPVPLGSETYVAQVGAFSYRARADALAKQIGASVLQPTTANYFVCDWGLLPLKVMRPLLHVKKAIRSQASTATDFSGGLVHEQL